MKFFRIISACFLLLSCQEAKVADPNSVLARNLRGQWEVVQLKVSMPTYRNSDSTVVFEANNKDWKDKMGIKPVKTFYNEDGTFYSLHIGLDDTLIFRPSGRWLIRGDSLMMRDTFPERGQIYRYKLEIRNNMAQLWGKEDADGDGSADDDYYSIQWRVMQ